MGFEASPRVPLPTRGLKECPARATMGFNWALRGLQMAPEARGTNEASRRAEKSLTGHTRPFYFSTRLHPDVRVFCAYAFCLLLVFPPSSALRIRRVMQSSITVTRFPGSGFRPWRALCPSWASRPSRASCPSFVPFGGSLVFAGPSWAPSLRGLSRLFRAVCSLL